MKKAIALILTAALSFSLASCAGNEKGADSSSDGADASVASSDGMTMETKVTTTAGPTTDKYLTVEQVIGKTVKDKKLVGKVTTEPSYDYEKLATGIYDVLFFSKGLCSEYYTYYFYDSEEDYNAARKDYKEKFLSDPPINSLKSLYFGIGGTAEDVFGGVTDAMNFNKISNNWINYETHEIL